MRKRYAERARREYNRVAGLSASAPDRGGRYCHARRSGLPPRVSRRRHARRRSRHAAPSMAVRHRCLAVSRPRGVRVGLSAALRGPCEPVGVLQGTPGNPHSATSTPFSQRRWRRAVRRSGVRMHCNRGNLCAVVGSLFRADCRCRARTTGRGSNGSMRTIAPTISAIRAPSRSSSAAAWPPAGRVAPESAAQRPSEALPNLRRHPEAPRNRLVPVNAVPSAIPATAGSRAIRHACSRTSNNNPTPALRRRRGTRDASDLSTYPQRHDTPSRTPPPLPAPHF